MTHQFTIFYALNFVLICFRRLGVKKNESTGPLQFRSNKKRNGNIGNKYADLSGMILFSFNLSLTGLGELL